MIIHLCHWFLIHTSISEREAGSAPSLASNWWPRGEGPLLPLLIPSDTQASWKWCFGFIATRVIYKIIKARVRNQPSSSKAKHAEKELNSHRKGQVQPSHGILSNSVEKFWFMERRRKCINNLPKANFFIIATRNDQRRRILYVCTLHMEKTQESALQRPTIQNKIK